MSIDILPFIGIQVGFEYHHKIALFIDVICIRFVIFFDGEPNGF